MAHLNALLLFSSATLLVARYTAFYPGRIWRDSNGVVIDAHGAGFLREGDTYYWYGETRHGEPSTQASCFRNQVSIEPGLRAGFTPGVNLYTSDGDLYNWRHMGLVFPANITGSHCLERPKVIKCPGTGRYVMWAKGFPQDGSVRAVIATSSSPLGPFELVNSSSPFFAPDGNRTFADATLHSDSTTGKTYVFFRTREDGLRVGVLTDDCTDLDGPSVLIADKKHEAPAVFQANDQVYLWTSGTSGFSANPAKLLVSKSGAFFGPYTLAGNPTHDPASFTSQSTFVLANPKYVAGSQLPPFIFIADRWQVDTANFGTYVWLPLFVDKNGIVSVSNETSWKYGSTIEYV